jgi:DnaK suppressor protein
MKSAVRRAPLLRGPRKNAVAFSRRRARGRQHKLIAKIDAALARIEDGTDGYCKEAGKPIAIKRLDARPTATLSIEAQERHERRERVHRDE